MTNGWMKFGMAAKEHKAAEPQPKKTEISQQGHKGHEDKTLSAKLRQ
jgi:hypothetical protein